MGQTVREATGGKDISGVLETETPTFNRGGGSTIEEEDQVERQMHSAFTVISETVSRRRGCGTKTGRKTSSVVFWRPRGETLST